MYLKIHNKVRSLWKQFAIFIVCLLSTTVLQAEPPARSSMENPTVVTLIVIMCALLLVIGILANVLINAAGYFFEKEKEKEKRSTSTDIIKPVVITGFLLLSFSSMAQTTTPVAAVTDQINGMSAVAFYVMTGVIGVEVLIIFAMLFAVKSFLAKEKIRSAVTKKHKTKQLVSWWQKINSFKPMEEEANLDLGHDYDGIRELNNRLPGWWLYGFYACIVFAGIYLYRYHVSHSAPLSHEEFQIAMQKAEEEKTLYLKNAANLVDENTVKLLTDANDLAEGKKIFTNPAFCTACHKSDGGGIVGPNLTDEYWLYGGNIKDIFKTIKYGTSKGMKSWKDELSPLQIAQVASYVKSLRGTNPPGAKEQQGDLYKEDTAVPDSSINKDLKKTAGIN